MKPRWIDPTFRPTFEQLWKSVHMKRFLWAEARRHFARDVDLQEDAISEAWERIVKQSPGQNFDEYKKHGARAIAAMYKRLLYRRHQAQEISIDDGKKEKPSSGLMQLAQKAIDGDW